MDLTNVLAIRELSPQEADTPHPVQLTGVVTQLASDRSSLFLQDRSGGVYVRLDAPPPPGVRPGSQLLVVGRTKSGWFSPIVVGATLQVLGEAAIPDPLPFDLSATDSRWLDGQYVQCHCLVRELQVEDGRERLIVQGMDGVGRIEFVGPLDQETAKQWVGSVLRVRGVCMPVFDADHKATGLARIRVSAFTDIEVVQTAERVSAIPVRTAAHLREYLPGASPIPLVRTAGVVVAHAPPAVLLVQDATGGYSVRMSSASADDFPPGTRVRVSGFLAWNSGRIAIGSANVSNDGQEPLPVPRVLRSTADALAADSCRVRFTGQVTNALADQFTLFFDGLTMTVRLPAELATVDVGATVTVTGALLTRFDLNTGLVILPLSADDILIDRPPDRPMVTRTQGLIAGCLVLGLLLTATVWVFALRSAVRVRTRLLAESEQKFATAFRDSPDAIVITRMDDGQFVEVNDRYLALCGLSREQLVGRSSPDIAWECATAREVMLAKLHDRGEIRDFTTRIKVRDGGVRDVRFSCSPITINAVPCLLSVLRDVTEQRNAERAAATEQRFSESLIESLPGVVYCYNTSGRFVRWNKNLEMATGYSADEMARLDPLDFFAAEEKETLRERIAEVFATGDSQAEAGFIGKDGRATRYYFTGRRVMLDDVPHLIGIGVDVSARQAAEERLAESERRYRELVELANSIILRWTPEGRITLLNEFGQRFFGYSEDEIVGQHVLDTIVPHRESTGRDLETLMEKVCADPKSFEQNLNENKRRNGERAWIAWTNRVVVDGDGRVVEILSIGTDVTEERRQQAALVASEKMFAAIFRLSPVAIALARAEDGTLVDVNQGFADLYRISREQALNTPVAGLGLDLNPARSRTRFEELKRAGRFRDVEMEVQRADGTPAVVYGSAELIRIDDADYIISCAVDITERRQAERARAESEGKAAAVFRLSPVSLALSQMDGGIVEVNQAFERTYRLRREQVIGRRGEEFPELYESPAEREELVRQLREAGRLEGVERRRVRSDGRVIETVLSAEIVELDGVDHALVASTDVSAMKQAQAALREANATLEQRVVERTEELETTNRELEAFCYSVSHDLRAPLRSIDGFTQAVLEDWADTLDADAKLYLSRVRAAARRMSELIDDLLTLSRVSRSAMNRQGVNLSELAAEVVAELRQADPHRVVEVRIAPDLTARGDRPLLRVVLDNLFGNAWKYTGRVADARIEFGCTPGTGGSVYYVRDNGAGFDPNYAHKLFQPFQRLHRADEFPGHGVGLATVLRIVRRHRGTVSADSELGRGATFRFTIPWQSEERA